MKAMPPFCGNHHGVRGMLVLSAAVRFAVAGRMRLLGLDQWGCDSLGGCASLGGRTHRWVWSMRYTSLGGRAHAG